MGKEQKLMQKLEKIMPLFKLFLVLKFFFKFYSIRKLQKIAERKKKKKIVKRSKFQRRVRGRIIVYRYSFKDLVFSFMLKKKIIRRYKRCSKLLLFDIVKKQKQVRFQNMNLKAIRAGQLYFEHFRALPFTTRLMLKKVRKRFFREKIKKYDRNCPKYVKLKKLWWLKKKLKFIPYRKPWIRRRLAAGNRSNKKVLDIKKFFINERYKKSSIYTNNSLNNKKYVYFYNFKSNFRLFYFKNNLVYTNMLSIFKYKKKNSKKILYFVFTRKNFYKFNMFFNKKKVYSNNFYDFKDKIRTKDLIHEILRPIIMNFVAKYKIKNVIMVLKRKKFESLKKRKKKKKKILNELAFYMVRNVSKMFRSFAKNGIIKFKFKTYVNVAYSKITKKWKKKRRK